jgi:hypothetical protein
MAQCNRNTGFAVRFISRLCLALIPALKAVSTHLNDGDSMSDILCLTRTIQFNIDTHVYYKRRWHRWQQQKGKVDYR